VVMIVDKALAFDKEARWSDARAMQRAVRLAYQEMTGDPTATMPLLSGAARVEGIEDGGISGVRSAPSVWATSGVQRAVQVRGGARAAVIVGGTVVLVVGVALGLGRLERSRQGESPVARPAESAPAEAVEASSPAPEVLPTEQGATAPSASGYRPAA